jgi:hypothetical protein
MVDQMELTVRDRSTEMVDQEATVVQVERVVLLEVEDEAGQADKDAKDSVDHLDRKSHVLFPLFWHIPVDVRLGGGGCREDFFL